MPLKKGDANIGERGNALIEAEVECRVKNYLTGEFEMDGKGKDWKKTFWPGI